MNTKMVLNFPIRRIVWGVWSNAFKAFIHCHPPQKDNFSTWIAADNYINSQYSRNAIIKDNIYAKPKNIYAYDEVS